MTVVEMILLICGGMPVFESVLHSFGTAGTGGFGIRSDSLGSYSSYCQIVISVFMLLFGVNFNLYYLLLLGKLKSVFKSTELWAYLSIVALSVTAIAANIYNIYGNVADSLRLSFFQVSSVVTTTGYSTANFDLWPGLSKGILLILMFFGACSGSTAGGFKISRVVILFKLIGREIKHLLHPRSVSSVKFEGKSVDEQTLGSVATYTAIYLLCFVGVFLLISFEDFGLETNFSAVVATFNNIGPGFGKVGAAGSFAEYTDFSKIVFSGAMLLGRLEIFPLIIALSPSIWKKTR
jgi:trk system potassium uptake protein TrkH